MFAAYFYICSFSGAWRRAFENRMIPTPGTNNAQLRIQRGCYLFSPSGKSLDSLKVKATDTAANLATE
jgi:hypothetical protein